MVCLSNLVIVESPAKAKTIKKYLGKDFEVVASMGHVRDLPKSKFGVDVDHDFTPMYVDIKGKEDLIKDLKKAAQKSDAIFLATDPDREGEAISWHLAQMLGVDMNQPNRIVATKRRKIWQVFRDIDKKNATLEATEFAKEIIGIEKWSDVIPNFRWRNLEQ